MRKRQLSPLPRLLVGVAAVSITVLLMAGPGAAAGEKSSPEAPYVTADDPWYQAGQAALQERLALRPNTNRAKKPCRMRLPDRREISAFRREVWSIQVARLAMVAVCT